MIKVTVELISAHGPQFNKVLGVGYISNDGTGTHGTGNYNARLGKRRGRVEGFPRQRLGAWDLLYRALRACGLHERNPA